MSDSAKFPEIKIPGASRGLSATARLLVKLGRHNCLNKLKYVEDSKVSHAVNILFLAERNYVMFG